MNKHIAYHELLESLRDASGCPLCKLEAESVRRYLDSVLYESVNDPGVRADLVRSRGYCARHARRLAAMGNAFGIAMLYQDQIRLISEFVDSLPGSPPRSSKLFREWQRADHCPACVVEKRCRERYVWTLVNGLAEQEMRTAFESGSALCMPHFLCVLEKATAPETYCFLVARQRAVVGRLRHWLHEFCRKHDYRFSHEPFGEESDSWLQAIKMVVGETEEF